MEIEGRYRLMRRLGEGGTGTVYAAADTLLGRTVALKMLHATIDGDLLRREAQSLAQLHHPNVVVLYDLIDNGGPPCLVMEYVEGTDLGAWLDEHSVRDLEAGLTLFASIAAAVAHAHGVGVLHCDIKPSNILLSTAGEVKLTDFTLARLLAVSRSDGAQGGSRDYAAPEQLSGGPLDERTDVYALGVLLQRLVGAVGDASEEAAVVGEVVARATRPAPADRFASVADLMDALPSIHGGTRVLARPRASELTRVLPGRARPLPRTSIVGKTLFGAVGLIAAVAAVFTVLTVRASPARITLPDLVATNASSAQLVTRSLDLRYRVQRVYSSSAPAGTVIAQMPRGGSAVDPHGMVTLVVSRGPKPIAVPALGGLSQDAAVKALQGLGFKVLVQTKDTIFQSPGQVLDQSPGPAARRLPGATIQITISTKPWWWVF